MIFYLDPSLQKYFDLSAPLFDQLMSLKGEAYRDQKGRKTMRITLGDHTYFIKQHHGVGLKETLKTIFQGRLPVFSAKSEWQAIKKLQKLGVTVPKILGFGLKGNHPAFCKSFVLLEDISPSKSIETLIKEKLIDRPLKMKLLNEVGRIIKTMHKHGINHRDCYVCHFLFKESVPGSFYPNFDLVLIDLHRAQIRTKTPKRWIIKDLAGLYFSSKQASLTKRDYFRLMTLYSGKPLREVLNTEKNFWQTVKNRGEKLYRDH